MRTILFMLFFLALQRAVAQEQTELVTNQTIIDLHKAGLGKEVIVSKIKSSPCTFDLSTDGLIALKKANIPDEIITAMLSKTAGTQTAQTATPETTLVPGIYYYDSSSKNYVECDPSVLTNQKSGGFGEIMKRSITGLFNAKSRASLSGKSANTVFKTNTPVFTFVFDTAISGFKNSNTFWSEVQSPNEFFLVKLSVSKNSREVVVGKGNSVKEDIGIDDDAKVKFVSRKVRKGVYEVSMEKPLKDGEYCFMFAASSMNQGTTHKVYDFGVK